MELRQYLEILKRHKWLIVQCTIVVGVVAYLFSDMRTPQYSASARVLLKPNDAAEQLYPGYSIDVFSDPDRYMSGQLEIIQSEAVAREAAKTLSGTDDPAYLLGEMSANQGGVSDVVDINGHSIDPVRARDVANAFARAYIENRRQFAVAGLEKAIAEIDTQLKGLEAQIADYDRRIGDGGIQIGATSSLERPSGSGIQGATGSGIPGPTGTGLNSGAQPTSNEALKAARYAAATQYQSLFFRKNELDVERSLKRGGAELVADAKTPAAPVSPKPKRDAALGVFLGLLLGIGIAFLREQLNNKIRSREDAERATGLPILAELPRDDEAAGRNTVPAITAPHSAFSEASRSLRTSLAFLGIDRPIHRVLVTSPGPGDGKSMVAANLAAVYAQAGQSVALVSADLRRPTVERLFGIDRSAPGLSDVLADMAKLRPAVGGRSTQSNGGAPSAAGGALVPIADTGDLYVLPAGPTPPNPAELLGSQRMAELLDELDSLVDIVVIDSPPLLAVTDAATVAPRVDAVILVTAIDETDRGAAKRAREMLANADVNVFGLVLNKVDPSSDGYYRYYGYYGEKEATPAKKNGKGAHRRTKKSAQTKVSS